MVSFLAFDLIFYFINEFLITSGRLAQWEMGVDPPMTPEVRGLTPVHAFCLAFILFIFHLKIFPTSTLVIFVSIILSCFVSCHLSNFSWAYEVLNLVANEVYSCHDIGLIRVA